MSAQLLNLKKPNKLGIDQGSDWSAVLTLHDDAQIITVHGSPGSGTFRARFADNISEESGGGFIPLTIPISYNASAAQVRTALEQLVGIGPGNIEVDGVVGGPWTALVSEEVIAATGNPLLGIDNSGMAAFGGGVGVKRKTRDLTGYTARMQIFASKKAIQPLVTLTSSPAAGITINPETGEITLQLTNAQTATLPETKSAIYDLEVISGLGVVEAIAYGQVSVRRNVTTVSTIPSGITPEVSLLQNLAHYWTMGEASGNRMDSVGVAHLTPTGNVQFESFSNSALFPAWVAGGHRLQSPAIIQIDGSFSVGGWFWVDSFVTGERWPMLFEWSDGLYLDEYFTMYGDRDTHVVGLDIVSAGSPAGAIVSTYPTEYTRDAWHYATFSYNHISKLVSVRLDATAIATAYAGPYSPLIKSAVFGNEVAPNNLYQLKGRVKQWALWHRELTAENHATLYNGGSPLLFGLWD